MLTEAQLKDYLAERGVHLALSSCGCCPPFVKVALDDELVFDDATSINTFPEGSPHAD